MLHVGPYKNRQKITLIKDHPKGSCGGKRRREERIVLPDTLYGLNITQSDILSYLISLGTLFIFYYYPQLILESLNRSADIRLLFRCLNLETYASMVALYLSWFTDFSNIGNWIIAKYMVYQSRGVINGCFACWAYVIQLQLINHL